MQAPSTAVRLSSPVASGLYDVLDDKPIGIDVRDLPSDVTAALATLTSVPHLRIAGTPIDLTGQLADSPRAPRPVRPGCAIGWSLTPLP
jgi:hypothetical protein